MVCRNCGAELPVGGHFCMRCGAPAAQRVPDPAKPGGNVPPPYPPQTQSGGFLQEESGPRTGDPGQGTRQPNAYAEPGSFSDAAYPSGGYRPPVPQQTPNPPQAGAFPGYYPPAGGAPAYIPAAPAQPEPPKEKRKGTALKVILIVAALALVIAAAFAAVWYFVLREKAPDVTDASAEASASAEEALSVMQTTESATEEEPTTEAPTTEPATLAPPPVMAKYTAGKYYIPTKGGLALRRDHAKSGTLYFYIPRGATITVTEIWEDPSNASAELRWWGKTTYNGYTGWCSLYYATALSIEVYTYEDDAYVFDVWKTVSGVWKSELTDDVLRLKIENGQILLEHGTRNGSTKSVYVMDGHVTGNLDGRIMMPVTVDGSTGSMIGVDLSQAKNHRIAVKLSDGVWAEFFDNI